MKSVVYFGFHITDGLFIGVIGHVVDDTGHAVPSAWVQIEGFDVGEKLRVSANAAVFKVSLPVGKYRIRVRLVNSTSTPSYLPTCNFSIFLRIFSPIGWKSTSFQPDYRCRCEERVHYQYSNYTALAALGAGFESEKTDGQG